MATAVPSIREDLQRAKTQVKALTFDALNKMAPLLRKRQHLVAIEQSGDTEAYGNGAFDLAQELLWRNAVCTTEVRQLTFTTKDMFNQVKRTDVEFMDYLLEHAFTLGLPFSRTRLCVRITRWFNSREDVWTTHPLQRMIHRMSC